MGNKGVCEIVGMRDVWVETDVECKLKLKNVRHVPDIRLKLFMSKPWIFKVITLTLVVVACVRSPKDH